MQFPPPQTSFAIEDGRGSRLHGCTLASLRDNARIAGIDPKTSAVTKIRRVVIPSTDASGETPPGGRKPKGFEARNIRTLANAIARPNAPPPTNNRRISVVSCCNKRRTPHPSASRTANSAPLCEFLPRTKLPAFVHAINSSTATAPSNNSSELRIVRVLSCCNPATSTPESGTSSEKRRFNSRWIPLSSSSAWAIVTCFNRPITETGAEEVVV